MDIAKLSAIVLLGVQFIKRLFLRFNIEIKGAGSVAVSILTSFGVVLYYVVSNDLPFDFQSILNFIQVVIISNTTHNLIRGNN